MSNKDSKIPVQYTGEIKCTIPGVGIVMPGQTVEVPANMANNLARDRNWEKIDGGAGDTEIPAPVAPVEIGSDGLDGLDGSDNSDRLDESIEKPSKRKRNKEES